MQAAPLRNSHVCALPLGHIEKHGLPGAARAGIQGGAGRSTWTVIDPFCELSDQLVSARQHGGRGAEAGREWASCQLGQPSTVPLDSFRLFILP